MIFQVLKYDVFGDGTVGGRKVPAAPKSATPAALADMWELALYSVGRTALHLAHQIGDDQPRLHRDEHLHVVARQHPAQDIDSVFAEDRAA